MLKLVENMLILLFLTPILPLTRSFFMLKSYPKVISIDYAAILM